MTSRTARLFSSPRVLVATLVACAGLATTAHAQLRVAAWNISFWNGTNRVEDVKTVVYGEFSGRKLAPDVFLLQEFSDANSLTVFVAAMNAATGSPGDWVGAPFVTGPDSEAVCIFRSGKASLVGNITWTVALADPGTTGQPRNTYAYDIRPAGYSAPAAAIRMYSVHLKSGSGTTDNTRRLIETQRIRDNAAGIDTNGVGTAKPAAYQFIIGGDLNMQRANQTSYGELIGSQANNAGRFFDPINAAFSWNNNEAYKYLHTQDPTGAGGMDDRHDQLLLSAGLIDGVGMDYIGNPAITYSNTTWNDPNHSYRCWGNDGTSYGTTLTVTGNTMVGPIIAQALKNAATAPQGVGGHLPVYLDLKVPGKISPLATINFGTVQQSASAQQSVMIGNNGDTAKWTAAGIANVTYTLAASAGFTAPGGTFNDAAGSSLNSHTITMNTATPGMKSGTLTIASNDVDIPSLVVNITGTVSAPNLPPVANAGPDQSVTDSDGNATQPVTLDGSMSSDSDGSIILYRWTEGITQLANGTSPTANVTLAVGVHTIQLMVTDNGNVTATDSVVVTVNPRPNQPPVANAGADQSATDTDGNGSQPVTLDGALSTDPDGTISSYVWKAGSTTIATGAMPTGVNLPVGAHTITLTVTDNGNLMASDTVLVTINPRPNQPPIADAGTDQALIDADRGGDEAVTLDGSLSNDPDGTIIDYMWVEGATTLATGPLATADVFLAVGTHLVTLTTTDNSGAMASDTVTIIIQAPCAADFNQDGGVDGADIEAFFIQWEAGTAAADVNEDGGVDGADVDLFFTLWEAGGC